MEFETPNMDQIDLDRTDNSVHIENTGSNKDLDEVLDLDKADVDRDSGLDEPFDHSEVINKLMELNNETREETTPSIVDSEENIIESKSVFGRLLPARESTHALLEQMYENDKSPDKVFLAHKGFRTNESRSWYLPVVRTVEAQIAEDLTLNKEFNKNTTGLRAFVDAANRLILGSDSPAFLTNRVSGIQTPGGTAAIYAGLSVLRRVYNFTTIYIPTPTIGTYHDVALALGYVVREYQYLDDRNRYLDVGRLLENLQNAEEESIVIFHVDSTHRPSHQTWYQILDIMKKRHLFPLFHVNGQGLSSGDLYTDSFPVRLFVNENQDIMVAQSFSKIFGLGDERLAHVCIVGPDAEESRLISGHLTTLVNNTCGYTGNNAARIVVAVINNPALAAEWREHIRTMAERVRMLRIMFFQKLLAAGTAWQHVNAQSGMFLSTGLTDSQMDMLRDKYHIYMHPNGFINLSCLTSSNLDYVTSAINDVTTEVGDSEYS